MSNYKFLYLIWLLPAYLLFLAGHQGAVYFGINDTYENGSSYTAEVIDFDLKQIAAQTNGYMVLRFETDDGEVIQQQLSLPVEMAGALSEIKVVPVRYQKDAFMDIVILPTVDTQKRLALTNMGMAFIGFLIAGVIAVAVHRYVNKKLRDGEDEFIIERLEDHE